MPFLLSRNLRALVVLPFFGLLSSRTYCVLSLLLSLGFLCSCGSGEPNEPPLPHGIDLPEVGTLGRAPRGEATIVVNVTGEGEISVGGHGPLTLRGLRDELAQRTKSARWRAPDGASTKLLLVNADASLPWPVALWIVQVAAEPSIAIWRIFFGTRAGTCRGAIGWALPTSIRLVIDSPAPSTLSLAIRAHDGPAATPDAILPALAAMAAQAQGAPLMLNVRVPAPAQGAIRTGFVMQVVDVALRAGVTVLRFEGMRFPPALEEPETDVAAFLQLVQELRKETGVPSLWVAGTALRGPLPSTPPPPARGRLPHLYGSEVEAEEPDPALPSAPSGPDEDLEFVADGELEMDELDAGPVSELLGPSRARDAARRRAFAGRRSEEPKEDAVEAALQWLAVHQSPNGGWEAEGFPAWCRGLPNPQTVLPEGRGDAAHDVGVTGLALCAFLGAGYTNRGQHPYRKTVSKGLRYLKSVQDAEGCFGPRTMSPRFVYDHAIATLAMVEAYGMTYSPIYKSSAQKGLDFIALARNPGWAWRYGVRPGDNDTSVTAWMCSALLAARWVNDNALAHDRPARFRVDEEEFLGVRRWLDAATHEGTHRTGYQERGGYSDRPADLVERFPPEKTEAMTAAALWLRFALGLERADLEGFPFWWSLRVSFRPPAWNEVDGSIDFIYWYFGSLAAHQLGGDTWMRWRDSLHAELIAHQHGGDDPCHYTGSWDPAGPWGRYGGRVAATALLAMCLEAPYRYPRVADK